MQRTLRQNRNRSVRLRAASAFLGFAAAVAFIFASLDGDDSSVFGGTETGSSLLRHGSDFFPSFERTWTRRASAAGSADERNDGLRILALGGSVTWGAAISNPRDAYPYILGGLPSVSAVDNLAVRATSAAYPTTCIQSMIRSASKDDLEPEYNVILLEFSINGCEGLPLLIARLRRRYPDAVIIYVDHYSLGSGHHLQMARKRRGCPTCLPILMQTGDNDDNNPDHIYHVPRPENPEDQVSVNRTRSLYFAHDNHHLSESGHSRVANDLMDLLASFDLPPHPPRKGSWGEGDHCVSWFKTGKVSKEDAELSGGIMEEFFPGKFAYEVTRRGDKVRREGREIIIDEKEVTTIVLENDGSTPVPLFLNHMTRGHPSRYPKLEVRIHPVSGERSEGRESNGTSVGEPLELDPFNNRRPEHVTKASFAGIVPPGSRAKLVVRPIQLTELPFRIVGFTMCAVCEKMKREMGVSIDMNK